MNDASWQNAKLIPAMLPAVCLPRKALLKAFDREADKSVIYVSASAGYGKTVSALLWLKSSARKAVWIQLDRYDNTLSVFYKQFCRSLLSVQPKNKAMARIFNSRSFSDSPVEHTISLMSEMMPESRLYALVLENMNTIINDEIRNSLPYIFKRLPISFITLILTRNAIMAERPDIGYTYGVITEKELAFSQEETREYCRLCGRNVTTEDAAPIHAITGGWAFGVGILAQGQNLNQNDNQLLENYIQQQVWDQWDKDIQDFMLATSIVDEVTADLCMHLTGRENSAEILNRLLCANALIAGANSETYRYHSMFLLFLQKKRKTMGWDTGSLYKAAAEYYMIRNDYFTARHYAVKSRDEATIGQVLYQFSRLYTDLGKYLKDSTMFIQHEAPEILCEQYPVLYMSHVLVHHINGNAAAVCHNLDRLYIHMSKLAQQFPHIAFAAKSLDHRVSFAQIILSQPSFGSAAESRLFLQWNAAIRMQMPFLHRSDRDYSELVCKNMSSTFQLMSDTIGDDAFELFAETVQCGLLYECNRLKEAEEAAMRCLGLLGENTSADLAYAFFLQQAAVYYAMGNRKLVEESLYRSEKWLRDNDAPHLQTNIFAYKIKLRLLDGDKAAAAAWLAQKTVTENEPVALYKIFWHFITARAYIALGIVKTAMKTLEMIQQLALDFCRPMDWAEAGVLQSVLEWAMGYHKEALNTLETVLAKTQPYGFIRIIADEGAAILPVLKKLALRFVRENREEAVSRYLNECVLATYEQTKRHKGMAIHIAEKPVKLSKQQQTVVSFLAQGYKNAEIARQMGLSISTVKCHTAAAYGKLSVNNAVDAVLKARELGIID